MNLYCCSIDLTHSTRPLVFAKAVSDWMDFLKAEGVIQDWHLYRRKLNLASDAYRDFLLQIEVEDMTQLDRAFRVLGRQDENVEALYRAVHGQILNAEYGLYRPFPDEERAERMALL